MNMSFDAEKRDLRIIKTEKALNDAMHALLMYHTFRKITVRDICEEALVSRATFYSYYMDKYDLLRYWLSGAMPQKLSKFDSYEAMEKPINQFIDTNKNVIKNILEDADRETIDIAQDCIIALLDIQAGKGHVSRQDIRYIIVSSLLAGGIMQYLLWHIKNRFPTDFMNIYLYNTIYGVIEMYQNNKL